MHPLPSRDRFESLASLVAAAVASLSILSAVALLFFEDGQTPWLAPGSPTAQGRRALPAADDRRRLAQAEQQGGTAVDRDRHEAEHDQQAEHLPSGAEVVHGRSLEAAADPSHPSIGGVR
jgi:hypothetical protein